MQLADVRRHALGWLRPDGRLSWLRTAVALEALVVLASAVLLAAGLDLWGFAMVGVLCALITHVAFLRPGVRVVSLWGALSFVVTVGAGARGLIIALDYPGRAANNAMFLRGHSFASLVPEAVFTVVGVLAVTYGYLRGRAGESDGPARLDRRWLMPVGRMSDKVMGFTVAGYAVVALAATVAYYIAVGGTDATIGERRSTYTGEADYVSNGPTAYVAHAGVVALLLYLAWRLQNDRRLRPVELGVAALLAVNAFGINWVTTTRSDLVYVTLGLLLVLQLIRGRLSLRLALALGLAVIVGIGGLTALRGGGASEGGSGLSIAFGVKSSLLNRNGFDLGKTLLVTDAVPAKLPYEYGQTIVTYVVAPIPRAVWPGKPVVSPGPTIGKKIYNLGRTGVPPGMLAELSWNFGQTLAVVLSLVAGFGLGRLERWALKIRADTLVLVLCYALTLLPVGKELMGVAVGQTGSAVLQSLGLILPLAVVSRFFATPDPVQTDAAGADGATAQRRGRHRQAGLPRVGS